MWISEFVLGLLVGAVVTFVAIVIFGLHQNRKKGRQ